MASLEDIKTIGVIGAGQMGNGIAHVIALAGYDVRILDISQDALDKAIGVMEKNMDRQVKKEIITAAQKDAALKLISTGTEYTFLSDCDLVIEAATENEEIKKTDLQGSVPGARPGSDHRDQHLFDFGHPSGVLYRPPGEVHGHALHEPGAADETGGTDPWYCHGRNHLSHHS